LTLLAAALSSSSSSSTISDVEPGLLGFLVVAGMGVLLVFLLRSMNKQFRKLGPPPDEDDEDDVAVGAVGPQGAASDGGPSGGEAALMGDTGAGFDPGAQTGTGFKAVDARAIDAAAADSAANGRKGRS
jgi:hypothetical protein